MVHEDTKTRPPNHLGQEEGMKTENIARTIHAPLPLGDGRYSVRCIRATAEVWDKETTLWWPITGRWHEDAEIIEFPTWHFHVDWRFTTDNERAIAARSTRIILSKVITGSMIRPIGTHEPDETKTKGTRGTLPRAHPETWIRNEIRKIRKEQPEGWPNNTRWLEKLEEKYANAQLGGTNGWICPHRGANLETFAKPGTTTVQCPLHGLRWCTKTGKLAPQTKTNRRKEGRAGRTEDHANPK